MRNDKNQALQLRLRGKSYSEIKSILGIPKSTLAGWFTGLVLSDKVRRRLLQRSRAGAIEALLQRNINQTAAAQTRAAAAQKQSAQTIGKLTRRELLLIGTALYWAEGYKRPVVRNGRTRTYHAVSITNSDPLLVSVFVRFLRDCCRVPLQKIKASLRLYKHLNEKELIQFWHRTTGIPLDNFRKTYYGISSASKGQRPYNRLPYGVIQIVVADTKLFHTIIGYIEGIKKVV